MTPSADETPINLLTGRETQLLPFLLNGKCNKEIACALGITVRTVRFHVSNILAKYHVENRLALLVAHSRSGDSGAGDTSAISPDHRLTPFLH